MAARSVARANAFGRMTIVLNSQISAVFTTNATGKPSINVRNDFPGFVIDKPFVLGRSPSPKHSSQRLSMPLHDPVVAYIPGSNLEAYLVQNALLESGVEAAVIEDVSQMGTWMGGVATQLHKPQVLVERANIDQARAIIADYERRTNERCQHEPNETQILVTCEECGKDSSFTMAQNGSTQLCPNCGAYIDVGEPAPIDDSAEFKNSHEI